MKQDEYNTDSKKVGKLNVNISAGDNKIKYYECKDDTCVFEILDDDKDDCSVNEENNECVCQTEEYDEEEIEDNSEECTKEVEDDSCNGRINIKAIIDCMNNEPLEGAKVNLYKINGLAPVLVKSQFTDENGKVMFDNIENGCYRVIEIIDKRFFEKPKYLNWNEIIIDKYNKKEKILIVNKIRKSPQINKHN